jgi:hypothetical protein
MIRSATTLLIAVTATALIATTVSADHHETPWDQAEVAKLAEEFVAVIGKIGVAQASAARAENSEARDLVKNDLAMLKHNAKYLARILKQGQTRKSTWPVANRCGDLVARTRRHAAETPVLPDQADNIARAEEIIAKIRGFYGKDPAES